MLFSVEEFASEMWQALFANKGYKLTFKELTTIGGDGYFSPPSPTGF